MLLPIPAINIALLRRACSYGTATSNFGRARYYRQVTPTELRMRMAKLQCLTCHRFGCPCWGPASGPEKRRQVTALQGVRGFTRGECLQTPIRRRGAERLVRQRFLRHADRGRLPKLTFPSGDHYSSQTVSNHVNRSPRHIHQLVNAEDDEHRFDRKVE